MADRAPRVLRLDPADNVAVATADLPAGEEVETGDVRVRLTGPIRFGHKVALRTIPVGEPVIKYHETIGRAREPIGPGEHVHVHNVVSARLPGPGRP